MNDNEMTVIRAFRDLPLHVVMLSKQAREIVNETTVMAPSLPGRNLPQNISYMFDEVFALQVRAGDEGEMERVLQTNRDLYYDAKDRSGSLRFHEPASLAHIEAQILGRRDEDGETTE